MPRYFCIDFGDADPVSNQLVNEYEKQQFFNSEQDKIVKLAKTEEQGDLYSVVQYEDHTVSYPRPFLFFAKTGQNHPGVKNQGDSSRLICLYDNAGESFQPGKDTVGNKVTRHLGVSNCVMYCFDPTQDPRMRSACGDATDDFQVASAPVTNRQDIVLHEIASRIKKHGGLKESERSTKPLLVICTKFDAWSSLMGEKTLPLPFVPSSSSEIHRLDLSVIRDVSKRVRNVLYEHSPEIVGAAESFSSNVYYIPVSATGRAPEQDEETGLIGVRPRDIKPMWCEVPMLLAIACWSGGLVPYIESNKS
ncbi:MAG: hypothetical protein COA78_12915 [Blastopirellula sp.]|nr:MAG: hypothetical protein COA78_12915 [Blastopirellula sp.]